MSSRRRVLWWLPELVPDVGGIATFAGLITTELSSLGNDLHLFVVQGGPGDTLHTGIPVHRQPIASAFLDPDPLTFARFRRSISALKTRVRADIYHLHLCEPSPILHLMTRSSHPAVTVLTLHSQMFHLLSASGPDTLFGQLLEEARVITTVSASSSREVLDKRPDLAAKVIVVPNGVTVEDEPPHVPATPTVLACGRLVEEKGFDRLIRSLPAVRQAIPNVRVRIAGDGPERPALERLCEELGVSEVVQFLGYIDRSDIGNHYEWARVVVAPSHHEGMPYTVLEAGERGRAVIGTNIGGINEVVVDRTTGFLLDQDTVDADPQLLASAITQVLNEPSLAESLGKQARDRIAAHFSTTSCAATYDTIYRVGDTTPEPLLSVIIPAYQAERFIADAIDSVLDQGIDDIEIIVVDDGSTDRTADVARQAGGPHATVIRQPNLGEAYARNCGFAISRGRIIAYLDADDLWPTGRILPLLEVMHDNPNLDAVFGRAVEFADVDAPDSSRISTNPRSARLLTTGVITRRAHEKHGGFNDFPSGPQVAWMSEAIAKGLRYREIDDVVLRRRIHATNNSHRFPFLQDRSRVAIVKRALDAKRRAAQSDTSTDT